MKDKDNFIAAVEEAKQRLAAGEKPEDVFDDCEGFQDGFAAVKLNRKWNYIDSHGNIISNKWFDWCGYFHEGFTEVKLNDKYYHLRKDGVLCGYNTKEPVEPVSLDIDYKKKYEQALEMARNIRFGNPQNNTANVVCEQIFPELKESEDEKVRKRIIRVFRGEIGLPTKEETKKYIAWLEKQGELVNSLSKGLDNAHERIDDLIQKNNSLIEQLEKQGEQNWSEEDEENFHTLSKIICDSQASAKIANKLSDWLESLKDRVK
jgi:hypothetical protein